MVDMFHRHVLLATLGLPLPFPDKRHLGRLVLLCSIVTLETRPETIAMGYYAASMAACCRSAVSTMKFRSSQRIRL